jgi:hypothetical protein
VIPIATFLTSTGAHFPAMHWSRQGKQAVEKQGRRIAPDHLNRHTTSSWLIGNLLSQASWLGTSDVWEGSAACQQAWQVSNYLL